MLTLERLNEVLRYDPESGKLFWKITSRNTRVGQEAGTVYQQHPRRSGYIAVGIDKKMYPAHRLAWAMFYGTFVEHEIDHIDGNGLNNRIENLRDVPHSVNLKNQRRRATNTSGVPGVSWHVRKNRWQSYIVVEQRHIHLGMFKDKSDAIAARKAAEKKYGFHENHGTDRPL